MDSHLLSKPTPCVDKALALRKLIKRAWLLHPYKIFLDVSHRAVFILSDTIRVGLTLILDVTA
jgi:hypothetical protein